MKSKLLRLTVAALFALGVAGCQKVDPLQIKVSADSAELLNAWRIRVGSDLSPDEWKAFDGALQEIKLQVMAGKEATGGAAIDEAAREKIKGGTVRDVLQAGWEAKLSRLGGERAGLLAAIEQNSRLTTKPGDNESKNYIDRIRQRQNEHLQNLVRDIASTEQQLKALPKPAAPASKTS